MTTNATTEGDGNGPTGLPASISQPDVGPGRTALVLRAACRSLSGILSELPQRGVPFLDPIERVQSTASDLVRSCHLLGNVVREHDDRANARERARTLKYQLSSLMNAQIDLELEAGSARVLDAANALARGLDTMVMIEAETAALCIARSVEQVAPDQQLLFLTNLMYECVVRADTWLRYDDDRLGPTIIERTIEFPAEYRAAGSTILGEFIEILRSRYGDQEVTSRITQEGRRIRLIIDAPTGREEIERLLEDYGMVVNGSVEPEAFAQDAQELLRLQGALEVAEMQLRWEQRLTNVLAADVTAGRERFAALEDRLDRFADLISQSLLTTRTLAASLADRSRPTPEALDEVARWLQRIGATGDSRIIVGSPADEDLEVAELAVEEAIRRTRLRDPDTYVQILKAAAGGVLAHGATAWLATLIHQIGL